MNENNELDIKLDPIENTDEFKKIEKELNEKIDKLILQNNLEHKQFAYQIAKLEMNEGFTKIG